MVLCGNPALCLHSCLSSLPCSLCQRKGKAEEAVALRMAALPLGWRLHLSKAAQ